MGEVWAYDETRTETIILNHPMTAHKLAYTEYLKTEYWGEVRQLVKDRDGHRCVLCNSGQSLEIHHRTYANLKIEKEHLGDVHTLCSKCHAHYHGKKLAKKVPIKSKSLILSSPLMPIPKYGQGVAKSNGNGYTEKIRGYKDPNSIKFESGWIFCTGDLLPKMRTEKAVIKWCAFKLGGLKKNWKSRLIGKTIPIDILRRDTIYELIYDGVCIFTDETCTVKFDSKHTLS